jgi:ketosteroid isomerase-like protein
MPEETATALEQETRRVFELLDALDVDGLGAMLTDDVQGVDEITRGWTRGRAALAAYFAQLKDVVSDPRSQLTDLRAAVWGDVGLVTFVLDPGTGGGRAARYPMSFRRTSGQGSGGALGRETDGLVATGARLRPNPSRGLHELNRARSGSPVIPAKPRRGPTPRRSMTVWRLTSGLARQLIEM